MQGESRKNTVFLFTECLKYRTIKGLLSNPSIYMLDTQINIVPVLIAAISFFILGWLWYSFLFKKPWVRMMQPFDQNNKNGMGTSMAITFIASIVSAVVLAILINTLDIADAMGGAKIAIILSLGFIIPVMLSLHLYTNVRKPWELFMINAGYQVIGLILMGLILGNWQ